jgi:hypothetical protein
MLSLFNFTSQRPEGKPMSYEYVMNGTTAFPLENYKLHYDDTGALFIDLVTSDGLEKRITAPAELPGQIDAIVRKYRLWKLKREYMPPFTVYDGYNWHLYIKYKKNSISSGGYNSWPPEKQKNGIKAINELLQSVVEPYL